MTRREIRGRDGGLLGTVTATSTGREELRDSSALLRGHFDPKMNETRDAQAFLRVKGNFLAALLPKRP